MYKQFYSLKEEPFNVTPDPSFLFMSPGHREALASIIYGVRKRKGFIVITGEVGVGKTTILRSYLEMASKEDLRFIYIFNPKMSFLELLKVIFQELGLETGKEDVVEMVSRLQQVLIEAYKCGNNVVLIIDEAQNVPVETLENLRMLSNLETSTEKLIQIVLCGQPEFEQMLNRKELRPLKQRVAVHWKIARLSRGESFAYIQHRMAKAALKKSKVFTRGALRKVVKQSEGIPRTLNILCDNALVAGFGSQMRPVNSKIVKQVITDLDGKEKPYLSKWALTSLAGLFFLAGLLWISLYSDAIFPRVENQRVSRTIQSFPIVREIRPETPAQDVIQEVRSMLTGEQPEAQAEVKVEEPPGNRFPVTRVVQRGDNLYRLTMRVYGSASDELMEWVKQNNPKIKDGDQIHIGDEIVFPEPK